MRPPTRLRQGRANINRLQPLAHLLLIRVRHRIRHYHPAQLAPIKRLNRIAGQNSMRDNCNDFRGAMRHHRVSGFDERAARVRHIIDEDGDAGLHIADKDHTGDFIWAGALFVD